MALEGTTATKLDRFVWFIVSAFLRLLWAATGAIALWSGGVVVVAVLEGIRAWWHYRDHEYISGWWIAALFGGWIVCAACHFAIEERDDKHFQHRWVAKQREADEAAQKRVAVPMPWWVKIYFGFMAVLILAVAIKERF